MREAPNGRLSVFWLLHGLRRPERAPHLVLRCSLPRVHPGPHWLRRPPAALGVGAIFVALTWAWVMATGQDLSWDGLNHHLYLPFSLMSGRFHTDLLAAGPQSYQNPIGYLPFYLSIVNGLWGDARDTRLWRWLALGMAWASPIFLLAAGTSSIDPLGNLLILIGLAAALSREPRRRALIGGAAAVGLAIAIKPTGAIFALAIGAALALRLASGQLSWRHAVLFTASAAVAMLLAWLPWAYWLWTTFHNPIFPLYNDRFQSPFAAPQAIVDRRFLPLGIAQWLMRPLDFADMRRFATAEAFTPDLRPLALVVLAAVSIPTAIVRRARARAGAWREAVTGITAQLATFTAVASVLWMLSSGTRATCRRRVDMEWLSGLYVWSSAANVCLCSLRAIVGLENLKECCSL